MSPRPQPGQKTVLITGCTPGGIGAALAIAFHKKGLHVITTARRPEVLRDFVEKGMSAVALDVTNAESIEACRLEVEKITGGRLDILINNAGLTCTVPATDVTSDEIRSVFETNVFGPMAMVRAFVKPLIAAKGLIVNISSLSSVTPYCFGSVYCATKGALSAYSRTLRLELQPLGVRVMVAMVGTVKSNISKLHRELPSDSLYKPVEDVYQWRLTFSQTNATVSTEAFAEKLVKAATAGPSWLWWWSSATPKWFWAGGFSTGVRFLTMLGEWAVDLVLERKFRIAEMTKRLQPYVEAERKKVD